MNTFGLPVSQPSDILDGVDYMDKEARRQVLHQLERDDPVLTALPFPCGPWGSWSKMALSSRVAKHRQTAERKRIDARGHLEFVREVC